MLVVPNTSNSFVNTSIRSWLLVHAETKEGGVRLPYVPDDPSQTELTYSAWFKRDAAEPLFTFIYRCVHLRLREADQRQAEAAQAASAFIRARPECIVALNNAFDRATFLEPGWVVTGKRAKPVGFYIVRDSIPLFLKEINAPEGTEIGDTIKVPFSCATPYKQPGFYLAFSKHGPHRDKDVARIYVNLAREADCVALHSIWAACNALDIPFSLKSIVDGTFEARSDGIVIYVPLAHRMAFAELVDQTLSKAGFARKSEISEFIEPFADGIGLACERPSRDTTGDRKPPKSFGQMASEEFAEDLFQTLNISGG